MFFKTRQERLLATSVLNGLWRPAIDSGLFRSVSRCDAAPRVHAEGRKGTKAETKRLIAEAVKLAKADYGIAASARIFGVYPCLVSMLRGTAGLNAKLDCGPKSGNPERVT